VKKVANMLGAALGREELNKILRARVVLKEWPEIVGPMLAERSHPERFDRGTVWVAVEGSAWAQELRMMKETILKRLQERATGAAVFTDVRFGVRPLPPREAEVQEGPPPVDPPEGSIREIAERRLREWPDAGGD